MIIYTAVTSFALGAWHLADSPAGISVLAAVNLAGAAVAAITSRRARKAGRTTA